MVLTLIVTGPTGSGKNTVAHRMARRLGGEIISMDSMKVYQGMDIGTAKPDGRMRREVPYHLVDVVEPSGTFSLGDYIKQALDTAAAIHGRGRPAILVGGTPLYLNGLVKGFCPAPKGDPAVRADMDARIARDGLDALHHELKRVDPRAGEKIHPHDKRRITRALEVYYQTGVAFTEFWKASVIRLPPGSFQLFGLFWPRPVLYRRINERVDRMVGSGLFMEAEWVLSRFPEPSRTARQCIGYKEIWDGLAAGQSVDEIRETIKLDTRRFARKQLTWFRGFPGLTRLDPSFQDASALSDRLIRMATCGCPALR